MKKIIIIMIIVSMVISGCQGKKDKDILTWQPTVTLTEEVVLDDTLTLKEIEQGVIVVDHKYPWPSNSLIVELENKSIVWVDTPCTPDATQLVLDWIEENYGSDREIIEINTGYHFDNLGGNKILANKGISIYASDITGDCIQQQGEEARKQFLDMLQGDDNKIYYDTYAELQYVEPCAYVDMELGKEKSMHIKDEVEIYYPGESHSPDNIVVYIQDRKVLFGGCMIKSITSKTLGNVADANLTEWPKSIEKIMSKYTEDQIVHIIPGHGEAGTYELLATTLKLFDTVE